MPASFLHGVEAFEFNSGPIPITVVPTAVIGLVGSAPLFAVPGALGLWNYDWVVALGTQIIDDNGNIETATTAGTTGTSTPPTWPTTLNSTVTDGTVTWTLTQIGEGPLHNVPTLVNFTDNTAIAGSSAAFGPLVQGYTIPYALAAINQQGAGQVIAVNVFSRALHFTAVTAATMSFPASGVQALSLGHMGVSHLKLTNSAGTTTYILGTDYSCDFVNGVITAISTGALTGGEAVKVSYNYADPSKVTDTVLVGGVASGVYTGISCLLLTYGTMGFFAGILIAPSYGAGAGQQSAGSQDATVASALASVAAKTRAMYLIDAPPATQVATAIANRGVSSNAFDTSDERALLCFPQELYFDTGIVPTGITLGASGAAVQNAYNANSDGPYSPWVAGAWANKIINNGYWWSPSNTPIVGLLGPDVNIYASIVDANADANNLNAQGIVTIFGSYGTGLRVWGNRSAAYPTETKPTQFIPIRKTMDIIETSVELAMLQFIDQPISNALIASILASVNAFLRTLIQRGALIAGTASFNVAENPPVQIAAGQLVFDIDCMPPPPAERLTFNVTIDTTLLSQLTGVVGAAGAAA